MEIGDDILTDTYDCNLTIDTIHLVAKLDEKQRQYIYDRFAFNKNKLGYHWHYSHDATPLGYTIHALPTNTYTGTHYNHMLQLQRQVTAGDSAPTSLKEIIKAIDWNIRRIDLAYDFKTDKSESMIFKHRANIQTETKDEWDTEYTTKLKTRAVSRVASYDRNIKEHKNNTNIVHDYHNRYEIRLYPASNDTSMKLHSMSDDFIIKHLSKYIIIPNIDALPTRKWNKNYLFRIKDDYNYIKTLPAKKQKELKGVAKHDRVPLESLYLQNKDKLFRPIIGAKESQLQLI